MKKNTPFKVEIFFSRKRKNINITVIAAIMAFVITSCATNAKSENVAYLNAVFSGTTGKWIDLTHTFSDKTIFWPTDTMGFQHKELSYGETDGGWFYSSYSFAAAEHGGTHIDAPIHFAEGKQTSDEIPLSSLIAPAVVIDVSAHAHPDYLFSVADIEKWEAENGAIPNGAILLIRTGWDKLYEDRKAYLGTDRTGPEAVAELHFPGIDPAAAEWLVKNRKIAAVGLDTPSIDYGQSKDFKSHVILYKENIPGFENVANLFELPPVGSYVVALPMKTKGGSGGPLRIIAYIP